MGGSIKKAQVGHVVISAAKTLEQKEHNLANITLLKSRIGKDGIVFTNCEFNNEYLTFDTETQNTLLGHEEEKVEARKQRAADVYKESELKKMKVREEIKIESSRFQLEAALSKTLDQRDETLNELQNFEKDTDAIQILPISEETIEIKDTNTIIPKVIDQKRAAQVYKQTKKTHSNVSDKK